MTKATEQDEARLERLLGYIKRTKTQKLYTGAMSSSQLMAFIDAAFALHFDSKSHTGMLIVIGGVVVYISSRKQKCVVSREAKTAFSFDGGSPIVFSQAGTHYNHGHKFLVHLSDKGNGAGPSQVGKTFGLFKTNKNAEALYWGYEQQPTHGVH